MIRRLGSRTAVVIALWTLASGAFAAKLQDISFSTLSGDRTEIRLEFDAPPPDARGYTIEQPARISLDLPGATNGLENKHHGLGIGNAREISVIEAGTRMRVVISLTRLVPYTASVESNTLVVVVGDGNAAGISSGFGPENSDPTLAARAPAEQESVARAIRSIDFRRGEEGDGRVIIRLSDPTIPVDIGSQGAAIRVRVEGAALPVELRRRLDVTDFATPVRIVDALVEGEDAVIQIYPSGQFDYLAYQTETELTVNVRTLTEDERAEQEDLFRFDGEKLSLNFQDIEVRSVLQLIADFTDLNLVASDTVQGRITLRLKNVPWDQALDLILKTKGLDQRQEGNVLLVAPAAEIAAREKLQLENRQQILELAPLRTEHIRVRYANATELLALFQGAPGGDSGEGGGSILSPRGSVIVDERTNAIIITDTLDNLEEFRRVLAAIDVPVRQVLIEARIVSANANFADTMGIRWGGAGIQAGSDPGDGTVVVTGGLDSLVEIGNGITAGDQVAVPFPQALAVDLGVADIGASTLGLGFLNRDFLVDLELSALASEGQAEVVARPKIITGDKQEALIESGVEIPFQEASSSGATSTSFKDATLSMQVTPQITPDDRIIMDLNISQDSVGQIFQGVPSINTNAIETQVLVENGQTIVLGGIFQTSTSREVTKTPFIGDLPYVGRLFRRTVERDDRQELLVFITPRIVEDVLATP